MKIPLTVTKAIKCGPMPKIRDWRSLPVGQLSRAERAMKFVEKYCMVPEGDLIGKNIRLELFQEAFYYSIFDNTHKTKQAFLSIARKNAKTATIATLLLVFIAGPEAVLNSRLSSGANSRKQAAEVYNYASKMIQLSPDLTKRCRLIPSSKCIIGLSKNVEYFATSAEGKTAHGGSPLIAILDEVGQIRGPHSDFVDAIVTSQGAYKNAMLFAISTQAPNDNDLFSIWIDDAESSKDPSIVSHIYAAEKEADVLDEQAWQDANPALGIFRSIDDVRAQAKKASRMPSAEPTFRNLVLNQRVEMAAPFISKNIWTLNSQDVDESVFYTEPVYCGLDLSAKNDLTAFVMIAFKEKWHVKCVFWTPEKGLRERAKRDRAPYDVWEKSGFIRAVPGASIDYEPVALEIAEILADCDVRAVAFDRWRMDVFKKEMDKINPNLPMVPFGQGFRDMAPAIDSLETELLNERMAHGANPVLTMCVANTRIEQDAAGNRKLNKAKSTGRIDGAVALAMAMGVVSKQEEDQPEHQMFII
jgi:phage terminase large subunit-like protein